MGRDLLGSGIWERRQSRLDPLRALIELAVVVDREGKRHFVRTILVVYLSVFYTLVCSVTLFMTTN